MFNFGKSKEKFFSPIRQASVVVNGIEVSVVQGDITEIDTQVIVNEANNRLYMEDGLAAIIKNKGGAIIEESAKKQAPIKVGDVILTTAGALKADYIIHAATTGLSAKITDSIIRNATYRSLLAAHKEKIESIAFPVLGRESGDLSYEVVSKLMAQEAFRYIKAVASPTITKIVFVSYSEDVFDVFKQNICDYLEHLTHPGPFVVVDGIVEYQGGIVMIKRSNPPFGYALPGGFVEYGESVEKSVAREVKEETSLNFTDIKQFKVYSDSERDPRFHTVSIVFVGKGQGTLKAASDAKDAFVVKLDSFPEGIVFDHTKIIEDYLASKKT
ncbi:MAG: NUDIX domain-containing protein [Candidatus Omnitrophica bacterium]|nr:NUDIX domain-containing protein [Candidatus Omnitrophota bacterium]